MATVMMIPGKTAIYALAEVPEPDSICYVGQAQKPNARFADHLKRRKITQTPTDLWLQQVLARGRSVVCLVIEWVNDDMATIAETYWIHALAAQGHKLTNYNLVAGAVGEYKTEVVFSPSKAQIIDAGPEGLAAYRVNIWQGKFNRAPVGSRPGPRPGQHLPAGTWQLPTVP